MNVKINRKTIATTVVLVASTTLIGGSGATGGAVSGARHAVSRPSACQSLLDTPPPGPPELKPTTITTIGQAYYCILDNYFSGPVLDDRWLLVPAFAALTRELQRRGLDQAGATLPALTGKPDRDWGAFSQVYEQINGRLPLHPAVRQAVAEATMRGIVDSLNDNHVAWQRGRLPNLTGMRLSVEAGPGQLDPIAGDPLFITEVNGPAETAGIRVGDEIVTVNDVSPFVNGVLSVGAVRWMTRAQLGTPVQLTLHRPATDVTFAVTLTPGPSSPPPPDDQSKLVDGNIAYVKVPNFAFASADGALDAIVRLRSGTNLRGVIIDLRGNGGGAPEAVARLLGAFVHDEITSYWCDAKDHCKPNGPDNSVPLLNLPLVVLIDRHCASACDSFASTVKDLRLGTLVGSRTAGAVAGPALPYLLDDGSAIQLPKFHEIAAMGEVVNTIGVAPDYYAPLTAADLSTGSDPGLATAVALLR